MPAERPAPRAAITTVAAAMAVLAGGAAACGVKPAEPPPEPVALPFVVSDYYSPDGYWGDGETRGYVDLQKVCPDRVPGAAGDCYTITYTPGPRRFAGINWQYPHNNWGYWPGHAIEPGATTIALQARGAAGGETVGFGAGQAAGPNPYNDTFSLSTVTITLTTSWTPVSVPFRGETYAGPDGVIAAVVLTLMAGDSDAPRVLYLDDVRWER